MQATDLSRMILAARDGEATLVIKNARVINVFTNEIGRKVFDFSCIEDENRKRY